MLAGAYSLSVEILKTTKFTFRSPTLLQVCKIEGFADSAAGLQDLL